MVRLPVSFLDGCGHTRNSSGCLDRQESEARVPKARDAKVEVSIACLTRTNQVLSKEDEPAKSVHLAFHPDSAT